MTVSVLLLGIPTLANLRSQQDGGCICPILLLLCHTGKHFQNTDKEVCLELAQSLKHLVI